MEDIAQIKQNLQKKVLNAYRQEYRELLDSWISVDQKAQVTISIGGIFVAAAFAFIKQVGLYIGIVGKLLLSFSLIALFLSAAFSVLAIRLRQRPAAPFGHVMHQLTNHLTMITNEKEFYKTIPLFTQEQIRIWELVTKNIHEQVQKKTRNALWGQIMLLAAVLSIALVVLASLY